MAQVRQGLKRTKADANVRMVRRQGGGVALGMRIGLLGHSREVVLQVPEEKLAGAIEDNNELGEIVTQVGLLTMASLLNFNLAEGPEELAKVLAKWAGIDLEALKKAAEADAGDAPVTETVDEDGDTVIQTVEQPEAPAETEL